MRLNVAWLLPLAVAACGTASPTTIPRAPAAQVPAARLMPAPNVPGDPNMGQRLFMEKGCGGCHTLSAITGATGVIGPGLDNMALRPTIAGEDIPNSPDNLARWIIDPPALKPGTPMPKLGITADEARDLSAFLYSLPYNPQ